VNQQCAHEALEYGMTAKEWHTCEAYEGQKT
jgi:hypothetical protein